MRYQARTAGAASCTERTACAVGAARVRALALVAATISIAFLITACRDRAREERGRQEAAVTDVTRQAGATGAALTSAKPACPATGVWQLCSVVERLDRAGLAPRQESGRVLEPPLSTAGVAIRLGRSELRVFIYADRAARERDQAKLDAAKYLAASEPVTMQAEPTLIASENLLAILRSRSDHQRERVSDALTAGPPQRR